MTEAEKFPGTKLFRRDSWVATQLSGGQNPQPSFCNDFDLRSDGLSCVPICAMNLGPYKSAHNFPPTGSQKCRSTGDFSTIFRVRHSRDLHVLTLALHSVAYGSIL